MINPSILRWSLGDTHWSASKRPEAVSPRGTCAAILTGRSDTSKDWIARTPDAPANRLSQFRSRPIPRGVTSPIPVTTTRRILSLAVRASGVYTQCTSRTGYAPTRPAQLCASIKLTASFTVTIFSAASSGISHPNSSSKAITSSTVSRLSAPRSSMKLAFSVTFDSSTPKCSTTIFLTRSLTSLIRSFPRWNARRWLWHRVSRRHPHFIVSPRGRTEGASHITISPAMPIQLVAAGHRGLYHGHAAVDVQGLTGDIAGLGACEKDDRGRDVVGGAEPSGGNRAEKARALLRCQLLRHCSRDRARRYAVHGNTAPADFGGDRFGHADHRRFCGRIIRLSGVAGDRDDGGDPDHPTVTASYHTAQSRAHQPEGGGQIDLDDDPPAFVVHAQSQRVAGDAGIVDQNVNPAHCLL